MGEMKGLRCFWLVTFDDVVVLFEDLGVTLPGRLLGQKGRFSKYR